MKNNLLFINEKKSIQSLKKKRIFFFLLVMIIACVVISFITLFPSIIASSSNAYDVIFISSLFFIVFIGITLKFLVPIFGAVFCAFKFKETKKKWLILISILFCCWLGFSLFFYIHDMIITYGI